MGFTKMLTTVVALSFWNFVAEINVSDVVHHSGTRPIGFFDQINILADLIFQILS